MELSALRTLENDLSKTDLIRIVEQFDLWLTTSQCSSAYELNARRNAALKLEELINA